MLNKYSLAGWLRTIGIIGLVSACAFELSPSPVTGYEWDDAACSDGRDNDDDGAIDCEDPIVFISLFTAGWTSRQRRPRSIRSVRYLESGRTISPR